MESRKVIAILESNGWTHCRTRGDHHQYKHPDNPKIITVIHPSKDLKKGTLKNIERISGLKFLK